MLLQRWPLRQHPVIKVTSATTYQPSRQRKHWNRYLAYYQLVEVKSMSLLVIGKYHTQDMNRVGKNVKTWKATSKCCLQQTGFKGLLTKFLTIFKICSKLCLPVEKGYANKLPKFQVHKLGGSWDIHIWKSVIFRGKICYFYIPNILGASDAVVFGFWLASISPSLWLWKEIRPVSWWWLIAAII